MSVHPALGITLIVAFALLIPSAIAMPTVGDTTRRIGSAEPSPLRSSLTPTTATLIPLVRDPAR
ncbi:MAG: hypothetical protein ACYDCK_11940, partial [Thermoplasmatota archaeon]